MMSLDEAQKDMRDAYFCGATGAVTSATVWLIAAVITFSVGTTTGIKALILGGMLIFPASVLLDKVLGRSGKHRPDNPLAPLAMEGTIWMILCIAIAVGAAFHNVDWFFPAMLLIIGGRYLTFATLFGMKTYWVFGATLAACALPLVVYEMPAYTGAFAGAFIEYVFGIALFVTSTRQGPVA